MTPRRVTVRPMETTKRIRVATYTRISTDEAHQPYSLEAQTERLGAYIKSQDGWELARQFTDQMTGSKLERPGLQRALAEAKAARFDLLLVYRVDRVARSVRGLAQILEDLDRLGVLFRSATEPFDTGTPAGRMMVQMLGVFAEFERATLIDRVIAGMERKTARGGWHGGVVPFGYRLSTDHCLEAKIEEAPLVRLIFELYANDRLGARGVAARLNGSGHRTASGKPWSFRSILTVIQNRSYLGEISFRGIHHKSSHPALVEASLFDSANKLLEERGEDHAKRRSSPAEYLLTGLVICARCGKKYVGAAGHGKRNRYRYYICHSRHRYGVGACAGDNLPADRLEHELSAALVALLSRYDLIEEALQQALDRSESARPRHKEQLDGLNAEIRKAEVGLERYFTSFESGSMPERLCAPRIESLSQKLAQLRSRQAELAALAETEPGVRLTRESVGALLGKVREVLTEGHARLVKALLHALVVEVRVEGRHLIQPVFRVPSGGVRILNRLVDRRGVEPLTF
jgi:site-specific DNA recombinase